MMNRIQLIGYLSRDPELKILDGGKCFATLNIATTRWDGKEKQTEWFHVIVWNKTAENCMKFTKKSSLVFVEGELQTRKWNDKDTGEKKEKKQVTASSVKFLSFDERGGDDSGEESKPKSIAEKREQAKAQASEDFGDDPDVPFHHVARSGRFEDVTNRVTNQC